MNKENMIAWAEALESGDYKQYRGDWGCGFQHGWNQFCCLNVAHQLAMGKSCYEVTNEETAAFTGKTYGWGSSVDVVEKFIDNPISDWGLVEKNDQQEWTFQQIAAFLRERVAE